MTISDKAPWHLWAVGIFSLLWNGAGVVSYLATAFGRLEGMGFDAQQMAYFYGFPAWAVAFWALGVWGSFLGSVALLMRRGWASAAYAVSIVGLVGTTYYERAVADIPESMETHGNLLFAGAIWAITIALFYYARRMKQSGVLR